MTLRPGLLALADDKVMHAKSFEGLDDTLRVLVDACAGLPVEAENLLLEFQRDLEKGHRCAQHLAGGSARLFRAPRACRHQPARLHAA